MQLPLDAPARAMAMAALFFVHTGLGCSDPGNGGKPPDAAPPDALGRPVCTPDILPGGEDIVPDGVHVVFPPANALTDADAITVRGTAQLAGGVAAIRVNGVPAQSTNGFRHWRARVPLQPGSNAIVVESEDGSGQVEPYAARVEVALAPAPMQAPEAVALDAERNRALIIDSYRNALLTVDLATGRRTVVHVPPDSLVLDARAVLPHLMPAQPPAIPLVDVAVLGNEGQRALAVARRALFSVELASGKATVISDVRTGSGPVFGQIVDAAVDAPRGRALVLDAAAGALMAVDLATGSRAVISDDTTGSGPSLGQASALALDEAGTRAFVLGGAGETAALVAVDLGTGDRTLIASAERGSGPDLGNPNDVALDAAGNRALVTDWLLAGLVAVDLDTGDRTLVSAAETASGPGLEQPSGVTMDAPQGRALLVDPARGTLLAVDLATGARTLLAGDAMGSGHELRTPHALAMDEDARRVLVGDLAGAAIVAVDLATGARAVLASDTVGQGPSLGTIVAVAVDRRNGRIVVANAYDDLLMAVDPATGARTVLSGGGVGAGPELTAPQHMVLDPARDRAFVAASVGVLAVALDTGDRSLVGSAIGDVRWLYYEPLCEHVMIASGRPSDHGLFALDLETGLLGRVSNYYTCTDVPASVLEAPAYDEVTGRVLGWHDLLSTLMAVDTVTGACTTQAFPVVQGGGPWPYPHRDMIVEPDTRVLLMSDELSKALMALDPETGERVILSR
jgi:DNA-binding beta-propeller fold protein YncE